eukprot:1721978-Alexandrium_andersonii.AAC.1
MCAGLPPSGPRRASAESSFSRAFGPDQGAAAPPGLMTCCPRAGLSCLAIRPPPFGLGSGVRPAPARTLGRPEPWGGPLTGPVSYRTAGKPLGDIGGPRTAPEPMRT